MFKLAKQTIGAVIGISSLIALFLTPVASITMATALAVTTLSATGSVLSAFVAAMEVSVLFGIGGLATAILLGSLAKLFN